MNLIEQLGKENGKKSLPPVHVGDTVRVHYLIREGEKERVQPFNGTVIAIRGRGIARNLIVRRLVQGEGVERIFPFHSPRVKDIEVLRRGDVRRAKLYYLRDRVGKQTKVGELLGERARRLDGAEAAGDEPAGAAPAERVDPLPVQV
ncbi:MAG: 50S ribosomal protein L19 [Planctomycetes bacterium]|nr:50S ribosomal protein L19 [Planctomycetota bacterium]